MKLYFLRHTTAEDVASSDDARELTRVGKAEARIAGKALAALEITPTRILTSPLVRARQTAEIAGKAFRFKGKMEVIEELKNGVSTRRLLQAIPSCRNEEALVLVGHMPSLSEHLAALIGATDPEALPFDKGGIACVEIDRLRIGEGQLRWLARQKQLRAIAK